MEFTKETTETEFDPAYTYSDRAGDKWSYVAGGWRWGGYIVSRPRSTPPADYGPYTRIKKEKKGGVDQNVPLSKREEKIYLAREWANDALNIHVRDSVGAEHAAQLILELTDSLTGTDDIDYIPHVTAKGLTKCERKMLIYKLTEGRLDKCMYNDYEDRYLGYRGWTGEVDRWLGVFTEEGKEVARAVLDVQRAEEMAARKKRDRKTVRQDHDSMPFDVTVNGWVDDMIDPEVRM